MPSDSLFGPIVSGDVIEAAVADTIETWIVTYLGELARQVGGQPLPPFRTYQERPSGDRRPEDQFPLCIVVNAGVDGEPFKSGDGYIDAPYRIGVVSMGSARTEQDAKRNVEHYAAVVRAILLHQRGLGGLATDVQWVGETYDEGPSDASGVIAASVTEFVYTIQNVVNIYTKPATPDVPPGAVLGQAETEHLIVDHLS